MDIQVEHQEGCVVIRIDGDIEFFTLDKLVECIDDLVAQGHLNLHFDLQNVDYFNSSGMSAIVYALRKLEGKGEITILNADRKIARRLRTSGIHRFVTVRPEGDEQSSSR